MDWTKATAPETADIEAMAEAALESLPEAFRTPARDVVLRVEDFASDAMLAELGIESPFELTGLYEGVPLTEKSVTHQPKHPDAIWLFRRAILEEWLERGDVRRYVGTFREFVVFANAQAYPEYVSPRGTIFEDPD